MEQTEAQMNTFIFTCNPKHGDLTVYEFKKYDATYKFIRWLDEGTGLAYTQLDYAQMYELIINQPVIFVRHIFFVREVLDCGGEYISSIVSLCEEALSYGDSFCVQTRWSLTPDTEVNEISKNVSDALSESGYELNVTSGEMIVSLYVDSGKIYFGANGAKYNLSHWKGGMPHYSPTEEYDFVSRAEYKLLEALECFDIDMTQMTSAADLGAAPGGWTKVLTERGLSCVSIDPNSLDERILKNKKVSYCRMMVEEYLKSDKRQMFDIVVNDMKMNITGSVEIINKFYSRIRDGGIVIITFKLPQTFSYKKDVLDNLSRFRGFNLIGARQLFHNRSEITAVLKKGKSIFIKE